MVSATFAILLSILIVPCVPIAIYLIGLLLPASHIVSRTATFKTSRKHIWRLLTDVQEYPQWQPKLRGLVLAQTVDPDQDSGLSSNVVSDSDHTEGELTTSSEMQKSNTVDNTESDKRAAMRARRLSGRDQGGSETLFVEYTKYGKRTVVLVEQIPGSKILRIMEERNNVVPLQGAPATVPATPASKKPTFSGSWTFDISSNFDDKEFSTLKSSRHSMFKQPSFADDESEIITLKVTQQGVIKKPMVRVSYMLLFGFYRSIDRFLKDLGKKIEEDKAIALQEKQQAAQNEDTVASMSLDHSVTEAESEADAETPKPTDELQKSVIESAILNHKASSVLDKDWDLVSEIYERKKDQ
ncbi:hypothetical protein K450DRAFT_251659 [Umbelopsis ramanniana AG]|uniref:Uncharacterized protein n=1 Tax=Umbelopsis ramanniana AG TaxID=1314678 RepID=A0AAD5HAZ0_UMBRA|nr:uncharacterized protein K450DRAFT_251659 [Umbelopsis ramanniana AG]KAI8577442.1 hypothetical protein K450DRAFT_251659 [Umbelopsis ramanniana AG]